ncbi:Transmembrane osmosensor [Elasticomyces elasticus]|nr:Transmembrane osmosensor [Elasticomyces elasticus]
METANGRDSRHFSFGHIVGDPFALSTITVSIIAWLIAFIASIVSDIHSGFPNFAWWTLVYMFFVIVGVLVAVAADAVFTYHVAIVGFLAAGLAFTTSAANILVYLPRPEQEAAAAGFILLSMIAIVWIFYFGSQPTASHRAAIDSFALHREARAPPRASRQMANASRPETYVSNNQAPQMYTSAQLSGFETSSPVTGYAGGAVGAMDQRNAPQQRFAPPPVPQQQQTGQAPIHMAGMTAAQSSQLDGSANAPTEYPYRAKAIYSYEANPDDANEISFSKHEILEVSDVSGRWWQAKKQTGETGIAPSNYLILL